MNYYDSNDGPARHDGSQFPTRGRSEKAWDFEAERVIGYGSEDRAAVVAAAALGLVSTLGFVCRSAVSAVPDKQAR